MSTIDYRDPSLLAQTSANGLMSAVDKLKLNNLDGYGAAITAETNRAISVENTIKVALDGYTTKIYVDGYASNIKSLITAETNRATNVENIIKASLDGYTLTYNSAPFNELVVTRNLDLSITDGVGLLTGADLSKLPVQTQNIDVGGYALSNFVNSTSTTALTGGAGFTTVKTYTPPMLAEDLLVVGVRVHAWETANHSISGAADIEILLRQTGSGLVIMGSPVWDKLSKGFPASFDVGYSVSGNNLLITAHAGTNNGSCVIDIWHQKAKGMT